MSDYTKATNFTLKDGLTTGDPQKIIKGSEIDAEYNAIASAVTSKSDLNSPTFTGTPSAPTATSGTNTTQIATTAFVETAKTAILGAIYPVGSIYTNASVSTNPATLLGFGTWVAFGEGRVAIGNGGVFTAGDTGGSADAIVVSHSHTATTTSTDSGHTHLSNATGLINNNIAWVGTGGAYHRNVNDTYTATGYANITSSTTVNSAGSSGTNANLQPYVVVYMWKRTA